MFHPILKYTPDMKKKHIDKECKHHGLTSFVLENRGYYRCCKCRSTAVAKRRRKLKKSLVEYMGGECSICSYNKCIAALEFHHVDPTQKKFGISVSGNTRSLNKLKAEADKCILVCANCHREIDNNFNHSVVG